MRRRNFIQNLTAFTTALVGSSPLLAKENDLVPETLQCNVSTYTEENFKKKVLKKLENEYIRFTIYNDASTEILDKKQNQDWKMGPVAIQEDGQIDMGHVWWRNDRSFCETYPGRFRGEIVGEDIRFTLLGREKRIMGDFLCETKLDGPWLEYKIKNIDEKIPSLMFPPPIVSESLVVPHNSGRWIKKPLAKRYFLGGFFSYLNMRWFGGLQKNNGWIGIYQNGFADAGIYMTELSAFPVWLKSLGKWTPSRTFKYKFTSGGYVGQAKAFRAWAMENGLFKSLDEKIKAYPQLKNLHGGRLFSIMQAKPIRKTVAEDKLKEPSATQIEMDGKISVLISHSESMKMIQDLPSLGVKSALVQIRGWIKQGYDASHPDVWPPDPAVGTIEELSALCALKDPFTVSLHDNYADMYTDQPSWPKGVNRMANGDPMPGGYWAAGQSYIINSRDSLKYAQRNWENIKKLKTRAFFTDTTTTMYNYQSYEAKNTLTRTEDAELKIELMKFYKNQGQIYGSEEGADFGVPYSDWFECRHARIAGESIPLWSLVYHDAVFNGRYGTAADDSTGAPDFLADLLWGYFTLYYAPSFSDWESKKAEFKSTLQVDEWHKRIGTAEMTNHRFLSEDGQVEESTFSPGISIVVNFAPEERTVEGRNIPGHGYLIK